MSNQDDFQLINLTPDMREVWGRVMRILREKDEVVLYALCSDADAHFERENIVLYISDEGAYKLVTKHKRMLDEIAGEGIIEIHKIKRGKQENPLTKQLQELFGDKLVVKS